MRKLFDGQSWATAGAVAAGVYGFPYPLECLPRLSSGWSDRAASDTDWDAELKALLAR